MSDTIRRAEAIKAIILDLDGVIIDSEPLHVETEKRLFSEYGISVEPEDWARFKGLTPQAVYDLVRTKYRLRDTIDVFLDKKYTYLAESYDRELSLFPDVSSFIQRFQKRYVFGLTTSTRRRLTNWVLTRFRLKDIFQVVVTADDVSQGKPHPEPYSRTIRSLNLTPPECLVIEDSVNGVASAKGAGAGCIALTTSFQKHELLQADVCVDRLDEITEGLVQSLKHTKIRREE